MKDSITQEWLKKAEEDFSTAELLFSRKKNPSIIGFHFQQMIEKYFKAFLLKHDQKIEKTHDLIELMNKVEKHESNIAVFKQYLHEINPFSVNFRYPGEDIKFNEIKFIFKYTKEIRKFLKKLF